MRVNEKQTESSIHHILQVFYNLISNSFTYNWQIPFETFITHAYIKKVDREEEDEELKKWLLIERPEIREDFGKRRMCNVS